MRGCADYKDKTLTTLFTALEIMTKRFKKNTTDSPGGTCKLTDLSSSIGKTVVGTYRDDPTTTPTHLALGDAILGAFNYGGYIKIERAEGYAENAARVPNIVFMTDKFRELTDIPEEFLKPTLTGTSLTPIPAVSTMIQGNGRPLIKKYIDEHEVDLEDAVAKDLPWIKGVNCMQSTGWQISKQVMRVIDRELPGMKKVAPELPGIGSKKAVEDALDQLKKDKQNKNLRDKYNHAVKLWNKEVEVLQILAKNMELEVTCRKAKLLESAGTFYQYVECDYRGRTYYTEPTLNYQGPDIARGLMQFSKGEPLNRDGLFWLAIHTAASYNQTYHIDDIPAWADKAYKPMLEEQGLDSISVDKMTLVDRERWTWENLEMVVGHADTIVDCEKPVVYLACCIEWDGYTDDPEGFVSHLPVPVDGSCNGYQHSAAISRDERTGALVSLGPQDIQSDLYVVAAKELHSQMPEFFDARPDMQMKHVRKGIAKRAVMTRAYSAGKDKIAESMYQDCHQYRYTDEFDIDMLDCEDLSDNMYELIKDVCPGATTTMGFLQSLTMFQLGTFETFDADGKKVSRDKKKKLHARKQALKKKRFVGTPEEVALGKVITKEEIKELDDISKTLDGYTVKCTKGNGTRTLNWWTPSGFHVIYEKFTEKDWKVKSTIPGYTGGASAQNGRITHVLKEPTNFPNSQGFQAGISPNWIHGEDAAHMMCIVQDWDGDFAGVHDSFSVHANRVEELQVKIREVFIDIYSTDNPFQDIVDRLLDGDAVYEEALPTLGALDIEQVRDSQYFFC